MEDLDYPVFAVLGMDNNYINGAAYQVSNEEILHREEGRGSFFLHYGKSRVVQIEGAVALVFRLAPECKIQDDFKVQPVGFELLSSETGCIRGGIQLTIEAVHSVGEVYSRRPLVAFDYGDKIKELNIEMSYSLIGDSLIDDPVRVTYVIFAEETTLG